MSRTTPGDVAAWSFSAGKGLHPDTRIWAELPLPWEVLAGDQTCTRADIERACRRHGVDPIANGWIAPRPAAAPVPFRPTPELVHGVSVGNPFLATLLREAGVFSGKRVKRRRWWPGTVFGREPRYN